MIQRRDRARIGPTQVVDAVFYDTVIHRNITCLDSETRIFDNIHNVGNKALTNFCMTGMLTEDRQFQLNRIEIPIWIHKAPLGTESWGRENDRKGAGFWDMQNALHALLRSFCFEFQFDNIPRFELFPIMMCKASHIGIPSPKLESEVDIEKHISNPNEVPFLFYGAYHEFEIPLIIRPSAALSGRLVSNSRESLTFLNEFMTCMSYIEMFVKLVGLTARYLG